MRDPVRTAPRSTFRNPIADPARGGAGRWLWIGALALLGLILVMWFVAVPDMREDIDVTTSTSIPAEEVIADPNPDAMGIEGNDVEAVTKTAPLPVEDADPNAVVPQDALIPPAPIEEAPAQ